MGFTIRLIGAEIVAAFFLSQVIGDVYITDEGKLFAVFFGPCHHFGDLFCEQILVLHHHHRNGTSAIGLEPLADALGIVASGVDHIVGGDIAFFSVDDPAFVSLLGDACRGREAKDFLAHVARALGEGLSELSGVNIAVCRIVEHACEIVGFKERVVFLGLLGCPDFHGDALVAAHGSRAFKLLHALFGMGEANGAGLVIIHWVIDFCSEAGVELC